MEYQGGSRGAPSWGSDEELFALMQAELFTAVVGDVMDAGGMTTQFLPPEIGPLRDDMVVVGRAMPVLEADCNGPTPVESKSGERQLFGLMLEALDDLKLNEVYVCTGASLPYALWGALMSSRAIKLGAAGAVVDGYSRDTSEIAGTLQFPTFSRGRCAQDQRARGRVVDFRSDIRFSNGVVVHSGDIIFGDLDGVVTVPAEHEADIVSKAIQKVRGERTVSQAIEAGMSARDAFNTYGIL